MAVFSWQCKSEKSQDVASGANFEGVWGSQGLEEMGAAGDRAVPSGSEFSVSC